MVHCVVRGTRLPYGAVIPEPSKHAATAPAAIMRQLLTFIVTSMLGCHGLVTISTARLGIKSTRLRYTTDNQ